MAQLEIAPDFGLSPARRRLAIAAAAVGLTGLFVVAGFPYDLLAPRVESLVSAVSGARVTIGELDVGLAWLMPELRASKVEVAWPGSRPFAFDRLRIRPALSPSWLRGRPALGISATAPVGEARGTLVTGPEPAFDGTLRNVSLALLPLQALAAGAQLEGRADAEIDVAMSDAGPQGSVRFEAKKGSLAVPGLPIGVPFEQITGDVTLGGDVFARLGSLNLAGPLVSITASGTVGHAPSSDQAPLALQARIEARDPTVRSLLQSQGVALDAGGGAALAIGGTLGAPNVAPSRSPGRAG